MKLPSHPDSDVSFAPSELSCLLEVGPLCLPSPVDTAEYLKLLLVLLRGREVRGRA